jgi:hypothetical protein
MKIRLTSARLLIGLVLFFNLECAILFLVRPESFTPGFELSGEPGNSLIQGMGLLFVMWNIPYLVALFHPGRHLVSLLEAVVMQAIGVIGESILLIRLDGEFTILRQTITRFIWFDGGGLVLLILAVVVVWPLTTLNKPGGKQRVHEPGLS